MIGESHALLVEFPEMEGRIAQLNNADENFKQMSTRYHELDDLIRGLETNNIPTDDNHFSELKLERVQLKDKLFQLLTI